MARSRPVRCICYRISTRFGRPVEWNPSIQSRSRACPFLERSRKIKRDFRSWMGWQRIWDPAEEFQAIALLRLNPKLTRVIGLEIEPHSMNLSRFNALLNGVSARFVPVNNRKTKPNLEADALRDVLNGEKLALVVTNPPFNLIPESLGASFAKYGYGGPDGLAVTRLFMRQAMANLDPNKGEVIVYSQFGFGKNGRPLFEKMLKT